MSTAASRPHVPVADQSTQILSREQLATQLHAPGRRLPARERIADRHKAMTGGDLWQSESVVLAEDRHTLGTLTTARNWRTAHAVMSPDDIGVYAPEVFQVDSATHEGVRYRVTYDGATDRYTCDCTAGQFAAPCHHVGQVIAFLRCVRQSVAPGWQEADLRYQMTCEDVERMQGMRQAFDVTARGGSRYRFDDDEE